MLRILVVEPYYEPDGGPAAPLFTMLCQELVRRGHEVTALTAVPHYPSGKVSKAYRGMKLHRTVENGVRVIRVPLPSVNRARLYQRLIQFLTYQVNALYFGWRLNCDVLISITPSLEVWLPIIFFTVIKRKPLIYSVHDVYPDSGIKLGIFRYKIVTKMVTLLEKSYAKRATLVRILSKSFEDGVKRLGVHNSRIRLIYDWVDTDLIKPLPKRNTFSIKNGLDDCFVVLYAGNIGYSQGLEIVLEAAKILEKENIRFLFIGEGVAKKSLMETSSALVLPNITFLPFQPREHLPEVLATADISLVILRKGMGYNSLPSKTLSILASGRPIVVSIDPGSDTWNLVERSQSGLCIEPECPNRMADAILHLKGDSTLRKKMGQNGREYALFYHSPKMAALSFERLFDEAIKMSTIRSRGHLLRK